MDCPCNILYLIESKVILGRCKKFFLFYSYMDICCPHPEHTRACIRPYENNTLKSLTDNAHVTTLHK